MQLSRLFLTILSATGIFFLLTSTVYLLLVAVGAARFVIARRKQARDDAQSALPPVSILKPVHGSEPCLLENLESFFRIDYPSFELIFCARNASDPALQLARSLSEKHPSIPVRILESGTPLWTNPKLYSMSLLAEAARYEIIAFSDSDVAVEPGYLRNLVAPLRDPNVGLVTCIYRGKPSTGPWSLLEALGMSVELSSGVLVAEMMEGMKFALAPTMVTRKSVLHRIGGFAPMAELLADDFWLGNRVASSGRRVVLSKEIIDHMAASSGLRDSLRHQLGWMKNTRRSRPKGHLGTVFTYAMPGGLLAALGLAALGKPALALGAILIATTNRVLQALIVGWGVVRDRNALRFLWLYPVRDLVGFCLWIAGYMNDVIDYRGEKYRVFPDGRIQRVATLAESAEVP